MFQQVAAFAIVGLAVGAALFHFYKGEACDEDARASRRIGLRKLRIRF
jgi:hypothetical protein